MKQKLEMWMWIGSGPKQRAIDRWLSTRLEGFEGSMHGDSNNERWVWGVDKRKDAAKCTKFFGESDLHLVCMILKCGDWSIDAGFTGNHNLQR